jgi:hypothetical protein
MEQVYSITTKPLFVKHPEFNLITDILFSFLERLHAHNQNKFYTETLPEIKSGNSLKAIIKFVNETKY